MTTPNQMPDDLSITPTFDNDWSTLIELPEDAESAINGRFRNLTLQEAMNKYDLTEEEASRLLLLLESASREETKREERLKVHMETSQGSELKGRAILPKLIKIREKARKYKAELRIKREEINQLASLNARGTKGCHDIARLKKELAATRTTHALLYYEQDRSDYYRGVIANLTKDAPLPESTWSAENSVVFWYDNYKDLETELKQVVATSKELLSEASHQKEQVERMTKERDILLQRIEGHVAQNESAAKKVEALQVKVELLKLENYELKEAAGITLSEVADIYEPPTFEELTNAMHMSPAIASRMTDKRWLELMSTGAKSRQIELAAGSSSKIFSSRKAIGDKRERAYVHVKLFKEGPVSIRILRSRTRTRAHLFQEQ